MKKIYKIITKNPQKIISEESKKGELICHCGHGYSYSMNKNMVEYFGFIIPICPICNIVPSSDTRQMDL